MDLSYVRKDGGDWLEDQVERMSLAGLPWTASMRHVPCVFAGHPFEILCGDAKDNPSFVPSEGVIGYDFFRNFTVVVGRIGGKLHYKPIRA